MTMPTYQECMKPTLDVLSDGNEHHIREIDEHVAAFFNLTSEERQQTLSSGMVLTYRSRTNWARCYLKKAGLIKSVKRGVLQLTPEGQKFMRENPDAEVNDAVLMRFQSFKQFIGARNANHKHGTEPEPAVHGEDTPDVVFEKAYDQINSALADELINEMQQLSPKQFERLIMELLKTIGYGVDGEVKVTQQSRDSGIDGIISEDKLGFSKIFVQIKQYSPKHKVSRPDLQGFIGAIAGKDGKGLFVTLSDFSSDARDYASAQNLVLLNGQTIANLMIEHNFGVSVKRNYAIKTLDSDLFAELAD